MLTMMAVTGAVLVLASLPAWLPQGIVALRMRIFTRVNGEEGIAIPGDIVDASRFRQVYSHPAARGRSRGATLSDLFWYWLSPGAELHQEHIEDGERYEAVAHATRHILALSKREAEDLVARCVSHLADERNERGGRHAWPRRRARLVRLRDLMMPLWAEVYYELVFREACPASARRLIVDNANDVATALKCCGLRHMKTRGRLTQFLVEKIARGQVPQALPDCLSTEERALYLQGVFFNTAIVQTSEAMVHVLMILAHHQDVQARVAAHPEDETYADRVIDETLRLYPLFGISHRITSADIPIDAPEARDGQAIPKGSVLCFNHAAYHRTGFADPERFDPDRWQTQLGREAHYIPYGVTANRPCPASRLAPITIRAAMREMVRRFAFYSSASHTRSIPNRGPCLLVRRTQDSATRSSLAPQRPLLLRAILLFMRLRDAAEDVSRSVVQLALGTYMVWDARRQRLCARYFDAPRAPLR